MCGRYVLVSEKEIVKQFDITSIQMPLPDFSASYNIGPGFMEPVVVKHSPNSIEMMRWGLIPPWAKDIRIGFRMINARAETLTTKSSFRRPFRSQRCIVPANGFYEWKTTTFGKVPYYLTVKNSSIFGMAGLYEIAHDGEGAEIKSYTIITTTPNQVMAEIHDRMPVILNSIDYDFWLDNTKYEEVELRGLLKPFEGEMECRPVARTVNRLENQGEELIYPV